jgi:hypothetical protein
MYSFIKGEVIECNGNTLVVECNGIGYEIIASVSCVSELRVGQTAKVWVNGAYAGIRIAAPYSFRVADLVHKGENVVTIEVANTLVGKTRDGFSHNMVITPSGLMGPVKLLADE